MTGPFFPLDFPTSDDPITEPAVAVGTVAAAVGAVVVGGFVAKELTRRKDEEKECCL